MTHGASYPTGSAARGQKGWRNGLFGREGLHPATRAPGHSIPLDPGFRPPSETVAVAVVAYHSADEIEACVASCLSDPSVLSVTVVDNSRDAKTAAALEGIGDARVRYVPSDNVGFAAGCNTAARYAADAQWLAFVNPDVVLHRPLGDLAGIGSTLNASLISANIPSPHHPDLLSTRPPVTRRRELLAAAIGSRSYAVKRASLTPGSAHRAAQVLGALMLLPKAEFETIGGLDERFELYYEDVDLCARAAARGGCWFVADDWGVHAGGRSSASAPSIAYVAGPVSRIRYLRKHHDGLLSEVTIPIIAVVDFLARTASRSGEGAQVRRRRLGAQLREWRHPGTLRILS